MVNNQYFSEKKSLMNMKNEAVIRTLRREHLICTASFDASKKTNVNTCTSIKYIKVYNTNCAVSE